MDFLKILTSKSGKYYHDGYYILLLLPPNFRSKKLIKPLHASPASPPFLMQAKSSMNACALSGTKEKVDSK